MSHGLQPTQSEEWKSKHKVRSFLEERALELHHVFLYSLNVLGNMYYNARSFVTKNDAIVITILATIILGIILAV